MKRFYLIAMAMFSALSISAETSIVGNDPNFSEENKVYGVAGVKFGDDRETVRKTIVPKSVRFLKSTPRTLEFYKTEIGGAIYDYTTFHFMQGKLVSVELSRPFYLWQKEEALMFFTNIQNQYKNKYSNFKIMTDTDEDKLCVCGAYIDGYDYPPIFIVLKKSLIQGGDIMYNVAVGYYAMRIGELYDDEI